MDATRKHKATTQKGLPRVLCVDDEAKILESLSRVLHKHYRVTTARSGPEALTLLAGGEFAVVVSDMRMPQMNGAEFLARACEVAPDTERVLLTGYADVEAAIAAINDGRIFRFLSKPCPRDTLFRALDEACRKHYDLQRQREILEKTLHGSVKMLSELLSMVNPIAYGRAVRIEGYVEEFLKHTELEDTWEIKVAAMLSQIGYMSLPHKTLEKMHHGRRLSQQDLDMLSRLPEIEGQLLGDIPGLEGVKEILRYRQKQFNGGGIPADRTSGDAIPIGARVLKIVDDFDLLESGGLTVFRVLERMRGSEGFYDPLLLEIQAKVYSTNLDVNEIRRVALADMRPKMVLMEDMCTRQGRILVARGQEISRTMLDRLQSFIERNNEESPIEIIEPIRVKVPRPARPVGEAEAARPASPPTRGATRPAPPAAG